MSLRYVQVKPDAQNWDLLSFRAWSFKQWFGSVISSPSVFFWEVPSVRLVIIRLRVIDLWVIPIGQGFSCHMDHNIWWLRLFLHLIMVRTKLIIDLDIEKHHRQYRERRGTKQRQRQTQRQEGEGGTYSQGGLAIGTGSEREWEGNNETQCWRVYIVQNLSVTREYKNQMGVIRTYTYVPHSLGFVDIPY